MKLNQQQQTVLIFAGVGFAGYFLVIKPLLQYLGIMDSKTDKDLRQEQTNPDSPFGTTYWRGYYYSAGTQPNGRRPLTAAMLKRAETAAGQIYKAMGFFNDDEGQIKGVFASLPSKADVSLMSFIFYNKYEMKDLISWLKDGSGGGAPWNGLSDDDIRVILDMVKQKPNV